MSISKRSERLSQKQVENKWIDKVVCKNYKIISPLNSGSFGHIYLAIHQIKQEYYAVKILSTGKIQFLLNLLRMKLMYFINQMGVLDFLAYIILYRMELKTSLCKLYQDRTCTNYQCKLQKVFSLKTVLMFLDQAIERLQYLHMNDYIHRDIKPENFMTGLKEDEIYLIDFGFTSKYREQGQHIERQKNENIIGTPRFCPICSHLSLSQNRASDLESLGYLAVYFLKGSLPWMHIHAETPEEKIKLIGQKKMNTSIEELCFGLPKTFEDYFKYIQNISFDGDPNYDYIQQSFKKLYQTLGYPFDQKFDWTKEEIRNSQDNEINTKQQQFLEVGRKSFTADVNIEEIPSQIQKKIERIHHLKIQEDLFLTTDLQQDEIQEFEPGLTLFERMQQINKQNLKKQK